MSDYGDDDDYEDDDYGDEFDDDVPAPAPAPAPAPKAALPQKTQEPTFLTADDNDLLLPIIQVKKRNPKPVSRKKMLVYLGNLDERVNNSLAVKSGNSGQRKWRTGPLDNHLPLGATLSRNGIFNKRTTAVRPLAKQNELIMGRGKRGFGRPHKDCKKTYEGPDPYQLQIDPQSRKNPWRSRKRALKIHDEKSNPRWQPLTLSEKEYLERLKSDGIDKQKVHSSNSLRIESGATGIENVELAAAIRIIDKENSEKEDLARPASEVEAVGDDFRLEYQMMVCVPQRVPEDGILKVRTPAGDVVEVVVPIRKKKSGRAELSPAPGTAFVLPPSRWAPSSTPEVLLLHISNRPSLEVWGKSSYDIPFSKFTVLPKYSTGLQSGSLELH